MIKLNPTATAPAPTASRQLRMTLASATKGRQSQPLRVLLYAPEGVGKSTFAASAPSPAFLATEDGTSHLDVARWFPSTWADALDWVTMLETQEHDYRTAVIDTIDWLEPLIWRHVCEAHKVSAIEDVGGGYGKGYLAALDQWRLLCAGLDRLRAKGMNIILLGHCAIRLFKNPQGEDFDRYNLKVNDKAAGVVKEWADDVLFATWETFATKEKPKAKAKGFSTGARLIYTTRAAAYDAKNRHSLPESLPLSWDDFAAAVNNDRLADEMQTAIDARTKTLDADRAGKAIAMLMRAGRDVSKLAQLDNWITAQTSAANGE